MHTYAGMHFTALCTHTLGSWQPWLEQVYLGQQRREKNGNLLIIDVLVFLRCCGFVNQYQQVSLPIYITLFMSKRRTNFYVSYFENCEFSLLPKGLLQFFIQHSTENFYLIQLNCFFLHNLKFFYSHSYKFFLIQLKLFSHSTKIFFSHTT